jgi:hypothetical protein
MISFFRHPALLLVPLLVAGSLGGCASMNEKAATALGDYIPQWAGGLPPDAPPRPGTAKYDEWMKERERQRLLPADQRDKQPAPSGTSSASQPSSSASTVSTSSGLTPVH